MPVFPDVQVQSRRIGRLARKYRGANLVQGLFVGSGATLSVTGPAPLWLSFVIISAIVWVVMQCLGELCAWVPVEGSSVPLYVKRYVEPSLAFAAGENQ